MSDTPTPRTDFASQLERDHGPTFMQLMIRKIEALERELAAERALADRLAGLLKRHRDGYGGQKVDPDCDCCDCEYLAPIDEALAAWKDQRKNQPEQAAPYNPIPSAEEIDAHLDELAAKSAATWRPLPGDPEQFYPENQTETDDDQARDPA